jgi:hypothetical protein
LNKKNVTFVKKKHTMKHQSNPLFKPGEWGAYSASEKARAVAGVILGVALIVVPVALLYLLAWKPSWWPLPL